MVVKETARGSESTTRWGEGEVSSLLDWKGRTDHLGASEAEERSASARTIPACRKVEKRRPRRAERRTAPPLCLYPKAQLGTRGNAGPSSYRRLLIIWITGLGKSRKAHPHATVKAS